MGVGWRDELDDAVRGIASGLLIGVPVVFTVDSWWLGDQVSPWDALILLGFAYLLTLAAVVWVGFRRGSHRPWQHVTDALEAVALAIVTLTVIFWTLGQIGDGQAVSIAVGRIAVATAPVSLGIAIANYLLAQDHSGLAMNAGGGVPTPAVFGGVRVAVLKLTATAAGALVIATAIVPTDELDEIATAVPIGNLPIVIGLSLLVSYAVVFAAGFPGQTRRRRVAGTRQSHVAETLGAYLVALFISWAVLWIFRFDPDTSLFVTYIKTVLLAFPASIAAAAGRLAV